MPLILIISLIPNLEVNLAQIHIVRTNLSFARGHLVERFISQEFSETSGKSDGRIINESMGIMDLFHFP
jgi:hypothetical protein